MTMISTSVSAIDAPTQFAESNGRQLAYRSIGEGEPMVLCNRFRGILDSWDPAFLDGSADRALGRWYYKVPGLFGGSNKQSEVHLRKSLTYNPNSIISHIFLAETLADMGRKDEARKEAQAAIDAPFDPDWTPEDRRFKETAKRLLRDLQR